uniref:Serine/threonine protein phosphatase 7 long form isogeny n=1 Tax=Cajanus cajan TaxID=3821 RepID=A0A151RHE4_CAJCA|nr:Serine/threonine protein phosphatase 7 long form isogeny [Cajanus cajan]
MIHAGPIDDSLLRLLPFHIFEHIWNGAEDRVLKVRSAKQSELRGGDIPAAVHDLLQRAGFMGMAQISYFPVDNHLISALVKRWRPETHTFHMPFGECTITLEDVAILLGLKISGAPITGYATMDWGAIVQRLLGMTPPESMLAGSRLRMSWIDRHFSDVSKHIHSQEQLERYTRAFILRIIGGYLLTDHSSSLVSLRYLSFLEDLDVCGQMSWGSCILANMYRELCLATNYDHKEIGGSGILLQLWAWYRFPFIAPPHPPLSTFHVPLGARWNYALHKPREETKEKIVKYREYFDRLKREDEFVWQPYLELLPTLPPYCFEDLQVWRSTIPLINLHIVEYYYADRVMRQFGMVQHIHAPPIHSEKLHDLSLRGKDNTDWSRMHVQFVQEWQSRHDRVWTQPACDTPHLSNSSEYMVWYRKHTRRWISPSSAKEGYVVSTNLRMYLNNYL